MKNILEGNKIVVDLDDEQHNQVNSVNIEAQIDMHEGVLNPNRQFPPSTSSHSQSRSLIFGVRDLEEEAAHRENVVSSNINNDGIHDLTYEEDSEDLNMLITDYFEIRRPSTSLPRVTIDRRRAPAKLQRKTPVSSPCLSLNTFTYNNVEVHSGANVELYDEDFMRIVNVIKDPRRGTITLHGWLFRRNSAMNGTMQFQQDKDDELCWIMQIEENDQRCYKIQGMVTRAMHDVRRHRHIRLTNRPYDDSSWREDLANQSTEDAMNGPELVCRVKHISVFENAAAKRQNRAPEEIYQRLRSDECDHLPGMYNEPNAIVDDILRDTWRGENVKGGACKEWLHGENEFLAREEDDHQAGEDARINAPRGQFETSMNQDIVATLVEDPNFGVQVWQPDEVVEVQAVGSSFDGLSIQQPLLLDRSPENGELTGNTRPRCEKRSLESTSGEDDRKAKSLKVSDGPKTVHSKSIPAVISGQRYTFGDAFCGAGGTSRGAIMAGLRVKWGFDFDLPACRTYARNFFGATVYKLAADEFIFLPDTNQDLRVDILHLSPPCGYWSKAHTTSGQRDEMNRATLFAIEQLLLKVKPRVVTLEEVDGLNDKNNKPYLASLIQQFTAQGYSVRWKIFNLADFGVSQPRKRILMIASCPGEILPPFPKPTHSKDPGSAGLIPRLSINQAISNIPEGWPDHDVEGAKVRNGPPVSGDRLAPTMTTSGSGIDHPSGERAMTNRENACLQGFPLEHKFGKYGVLQQIGNAVPPIVGEILLKEIKKALQKADRVDEDRA